MTKQFIICSSLILLIAVAAPGFADEHFPFLAEVSKESVNVRAGPNTNFDKIDKLSKGTRVVVIGRSFEWFKVQPLASVKEYIRSDYLKLQTSGSFAVVLGNNVNVRSMPNSDATSLGQIKRDTVVKVLGEVPDTGKASAAGNPGWSSLEPVAGTAVWVHQDFLKQISDQVPDSMILGPLTSPVTASEAVLKAAPTPPVSPWRSCAASAMTSTPGSAACSPTRLAPT